MARVRAGMENSDCRFITVTTNRGHHLDIRGGMWHNVLTRMRKRWPQMEAWTVLEWKVNVGVHMHTVVKGITVFDEEFVRRVISLSDPSANVCIKRVSDPVRLAAYLTKQLTDDRVMSGWPRYFRPVSCTRGWAPGWGSNRQWLALRTLERL